MPPARSVGQASRVWPLQNRVMVLVLGPVLGADVADVAHVASEPESPRTHSSRRASSRLAQTLPIPRRALGPRVTEGTCEVYLGRAQTLLEDLRSTQSDYQLGHWLGVYLTPKLLIIDAFGTGC